MYKAQLSNIPQPLHQYVQQQWLRLAESMQDVELSTDQLLALTRVVAGSDFVVEQLVRKPAMLAELIASKDLDNTYSPKAYALKLAELIAAVEDEITLGRQLRLFRQREMVRIIWRDLNRYSDVRQTTAELSALADTCIEQSANKLYDFLCQRWGVPHSRETTESKAEQQYLVVLGMGKLGANELNLSSDIDLMFCYGENGETCGQKKSIDNQDFFIRLGKKLIQALDAPSADGFVFRVDMRLRPFGSISPLACSFNAMENYYQQHGREWERYAMIKARIVAGDSPQAQQLMLDLKPFVYRKYIDYSAFESLREMKAMINSEVRRKGLANNVKLGSGGIREVEFIAQAFQLIRGGRDKRLQQRELLNILPLLPEAVAMPHQVVKELTDGYIFLRNTEHAIQAIADRQTQELPVDEHALLRIACSLGFSDNQSFSSALEQHRQNVRKHFAEILAPAEGEQDKVCEDSEWLLLWDSSLSELEAVDLCRQLGFDQPQAASKLIIDMLQSKGVRMLQPITLERLKLVVPKLLQQISQRSNSTETLARVLKLIAAILRRSAYLVLLAENPSALQQLVKLCSASAWFADILTRQPVLLDELITPQTLYAPPDKLQLNSELNQQMLRIPEDDEEQLMDSLRYFKHAHLLRVAASDITGVLPLMKVSDYLTWLAESILEKVLDMAWRGLVEKHGVPCNSAGEEQGRNFIVVAYGKLGGIELSYASDLDLVFLHGTDSNAFTNGDKAIANSVFFTRLGQRVIHILNTYTSSGQLYEIDMRLRPAGNSGMLVSTLAAFENYQLKEAWTWEHQALVRARVITGSDSLASEFSQVRSKVLAQSRDRQQLLIAVSDMREKMRSHLGSSEQQLQNQFNLKQDAGGVVDIEFLVQYFCLAYAVQHGDLIRYTDNIRILDAIEQRGLLSAGDATLLRDAYKGYRAVGHRQAMQEKSLSIDPQMLSEYREGVSALWGRYIRAEIA
ncbi:MAG: bifunctional [glutamate--ammonia ligase]-adenylyl-L-tyrosine phosphorylase/[glutamate--ammonia-ligase] adenylyltransferase [Pseudomonadales bacterium]|nr:bifunctional [glutamate--ammonia ligase]-adenylyl-L-tyrosine phosphorylase/[glutamate--ammonia-ligase] adenylyltransferase [Pseudomonadales bacterium]